jgi:hypothetical protein
MLLDINERFPIMIFLKSYVEDISFNASYKFIGHHQLRHSQLEPPFSNEIYTSFRNYLKDDIYKRYNHRYTYFSIVCYFIIKDESYKIGIDFG